MARGAEPPDAPRSEAVAASPPTLALVVLGFGTSRACAEQFARRAVQYSLEGHSESETVSVILDELRRWRWPGAVGKFNATVRGSEGDFGAIQSGDFAAFSAGLLQAAVRRHAVLDGQDQRWLKPPDLPQPGFDGASTCDPAAEPIADGPVAILLRSASRRFVGGLVESEHPADAGTIPLVTQFGASVAAGESGGVVLITDCAVLPDRVIAESVYAGLQRGALPEDPSAMPGCQLGYAILTGEQARVIGTGPFAWATAQATPGATSAQVPAPPSLGTGQLPIVRDAGPAPAKPVGTP